MDLLLRIIVRRRCVSPNVCGDSAACQVGVVESGRMDHIDHVDTEDGLCLHCSEELGRSGTKDHVPTRGFLSRPYPSHLPTVWVCAACNEGFSKDEQYLIALIGCVLSGNASPFDQQDPHVAQLLQRRPKLANRIADQRSLSLQGGHATAWWKPEGERVEKVIVKNARGHVMFESGVPVRRAPDSVWFGALSLMTREARRAFESDDASDSSHERLLPEVGSRGLSRIAMSADLVDGWVQVQRGRYRYTVRHLGSTTAARIVIHEYLAAEVVWDGD